MLFICLYLCWLLCSYLHSCEPPIIHGNLTCDTIFIQHNGLIKIGSGTPLLNPPPPTNIWLFSSIWMGTLGSHSHVKCSCHRCLSHIFANMICGEVKDAGLCFCPSVSSVSWTLFSPLSLKGRLKSMIFKKYSMVGTAYVRLSAERRKKWDVLFISTFCHQLWKFWKKT